MHGLFKRLVRFEGRFLKKGKEIKDSTIFLSPEDVGVGQTQESLMNTLGILDD